MKQFFDKQGTIQKKKEEKSSILDRAVRACDFGSPKCDLLLL